MGKRVLLVEGKDDLHVMCNLFKVRKVPKAFEVECPRSDQDADENGGIEKLLDAVPRRLLESDLERLAVVMDADDKGPKKRWTQVRDRLRNKGYDGVPEDFPKAEVLDLSLRPQTQRSVRFAVWVMPDNDSEGMLEDFVAKLIPEDDEMHPLVGGFLDSIPEDKRRFKARHRPKARIHSWLAVQKEPGKPMGQAIKAKYLDTNREAVQRFLKWITDVLITDGQEP